VRRSGRNTRSTVLRTVSDVIPQTIGDVLRMKDTTRRDGLIEAKEIGVVDIVSRDQLPDGSRPIKSRSIFVEKMDEDGNHIKFKYRAVPKGLNKSWIADIVCHSIAADKNWEIDSTDTITAFLLADIDVPNLTMEIPAGMCEHFGWPADSVWKVNKAIEGFRQSSKWIPDSCIGKQSNGSLNT
jgi:hypothetical protein